MVGQLVEIWHPRLQSHMCQKLINVLNIREIQLKKSKYIEQQKIENTIHENKCKNSENSSDMKATEVLRDFEKNSQQYRTPQPNKLVGCFPIKLTLILSYTDPDGV